MELNYDHVKEIITRRFPNVQAIYIFGSQAQGNASQLSHLDIGVLFPEFQSPSPVELYHEANALAASLNTDVDLIDLRKASTVLQFQIIMTGLLIYQTNQYVVDQFEVMTMSLYQRLNEERKEILEQIKATGKIYS